MRFAVFPLGMDYHLPHHVSPIVPHYRLRDLHALLNQADADRDEAPVIDGYAITSDPGDGSPAGPTVLDVIGAPGRPA